MKQSSSTRDLQIFAWIGIVGIVAALCLLPVFVLMKAVRHQVSSSTLASPTQVPVAPSVDKVQSIGGSCAEKEHHLCLPDAVCTPSGSEGLCFQSGATSPRIVSVKIEGAQFIDGVYRVLTGSSTTIVVQSANATRISLETEDVQATSSSSWNSLGDLKRETGGIFRQHFSLDATQDLRLIFRAYDPSGAWSGMSIRVASVSDLR